MEFSLGQMVELKKPHPCGGNVWEIIRVGADFKLKCTVCGRIFMLSRTKFEKSFKRFVCETENRQ